MKEYGLTPEEYDHMYAVAGGCCEICGRSEDALPQRLYVDHCHHTGKVRGLLCHKCNTAVGLFDDCHVQTEKAMAYLRRTNEKDTV